MLHAGLDVLEQAAKVLEYCYYIMTARRPCSNENLYPILSRSVLFYKRRADRFLSADTPDMIREDPTTALRAHHAFAIMD